MKYLILLFKNLLILLMKYTFARFGLTHATPQSELAFMSNGKLIGEMKFTFVAVAPRLLLV